MININKYEECKGLEDFLLDPDTLSNKYNIEYIITGLCKDYKLCVETITNRLYYALIKYLDFNNIDDYYDVNELIEKILTSYQDLLVMIGGSDKILDIIEYEKFCKSFYDNHEDLNSKCLFNDINLYSALKENDTYPELYNILKNNIPNEQAKIRFEGGIYK